MTLKKNQKKKVLMEPKKRPLSRSLHPRTLSSKGERKKVLIALSGGIDSAVSAYLLIKQGYRVEAAFMKNWTSTEGLKYNECPWLTDRQDALRVAAFLKIPLHTLDFEKQYKKTVMDYFFKEYAAGRTPNPDVMCNKEIKFKLLYDWAMKHGFGHLATGHYAQVKVKNQKSKAEDFELARSKDEFKDQTYFIYNIRQRQLPHVLFPVGGMKKTQVRVLAKKLKLPNMDKKESMGLCFVGRIRLKDFLEQELKPKKGPIKNSQGEILGQHEGLYYYTIGQRQGIKIGASGPYYVYKKDLKCNTLWVTNDPQDKLLETREVQIHSVNWIEDLGSNFKVKDARQKGSSLAPSPLHLTGRFRHQGELIPLTVNRLSKDHYQVQFSKPQKAVASGQSLVLYKGKACVGGGVIV